jgi:hypothetical protein
MRAFSLNNLVGHHCVPFVRPPAFASDTAVGQRGLWETGISKLGEHAGIFKKHG